MNHKKDFVLKLQSYFLKAMKHFIKPIAKDKKENWPVKNEEEK